MNRTLSAILLGLLMIMLPLAGCVSDGTDGLQGTEGPEGPPGADGSSLHLVVAESDLPECNGDLLGQIYFVSSDGAFQVCSTMGWSVVDLTGPAGTDGTNGTDGQDGSPGANGANGEDGADGTPGTDGTDGQDGLNGTNGANGQDGADGADGSASPNTMLTAVSNPTLEDCSSGGRIIEQGLDNGDGGGNVQNGVLEQGEVDYTTTYCSNFVVKRMADIWSGPSQYAYEITVMGTRLYFEANDGISGYELWAHESTNDSTWQAADINSGSGSGMANDIVVMGTRLYFAGRSQSRGLSMMEIEHTNTYT